METATFGAGCFWGIEAAFRRVEGVTKTSVGYMGGHFENPIYLDVCARITGHAEVVQVEYDPAIAPYSTLLDLFWSIHDPTSLNRQGADRGDQYRSIIFFHTPAQKIAAHHSKESLQQSTKYVGSPERSSYRPIVTPIEPAAKYWLAEEYHQQYYAKKGRR